MTAVRDAARGEADRPAATADGAVAGLFWVAIGASAGGLEAISEAARRLEPTGCALYVVAQHISPTHKSLLTEIIQRQTRLPVIELGDAPVTPQADAIYVAPANADVIVEDGRLTLTPANLAPGAPKPSINRLFLTLAEAVGERAIAVVLSGTGSDGAYGIRAVRAAGGITIAQDPRSAKYDGMPLAAAQTGCVDLVLSAGEIGARLARLVERPRAVEGLREVGGAAGVDDLLGRLLGAHGVDFRDYKRPMVLRRIERRMAALGFSALPAYLTHAVDSPDEVAALFRDLMISVTSFFRDPDEFAALAPHVALRIDAAPFEPFRLWIPACATGEEAYSLIMLCAEALGGPERLAARRVQAFATDIDEEALAVARRGVYPKEALKSFDPARLERFFEPHPEGWVVRKALRDAATFTRHNIAQDPPFRRIDLVSCRNLLIYFGIELQARVLESLRYALKPEGLLFLGKAETTAAHPEAFRPLRGNPRLLAPNRLGPVGASARPSGRGGGEQTSLLRPEPPTTDLRAARIERALFDACARSLGGDCLLISGDLRVRRCYGATARWLDPSEGDFGVGLGRLLHARRRREALALVHMALRTNEPAVGQAHPADEPEWRERLRAYPLDPGAPEDRLVLLRFERWREPPPAKPTSDPDARRFAELEAELEARGRSLSMTIEELETANEELQALNEEMQSTNEEVQSTNEELQTSNEELQSTNQELTTVNEELQIRSAELAETAANLAAILAHIATAVVVVDTSLKVTAVSEEARRLFGLTRPEGREPPRVETAREPEGFPRLAELCREALARRERVEREIDGPERSWRAIVVPYASAAGATAGAITIVTDETERRERARRLEDAMAKLRVSNAELERFSYVASHDLKEPVRTLAGYADFLADPDFVCAEEERRAMIGAMADNARQLGEIIDGLLAFSRVDREVLIETLDLTAIAQEATKVLARVIRDAGAEVEVRALPTLRVSRIHMRQLFQNLIGNAVKFRGAAACRIVVRAADGLEPVISVEDNGPGVPIDAREAIFEVFRRLHPRDEVDGSGLGLSICRKIVAQHQGRIWCEDSALGGAAFRFTLGPR